MPSRRLPHPLALLALAVAAVAASCGGCDKSLDSRAADVPVRLINSAGNTDNIHILRPGEGFSAANRLPPGGMREVVVGLTDEDGATFRAGRNGTVLADVTCYSTDADSLAASGVPATVLWNGFNLDCRDWN